MVSVLLFNIGLIVPGKWWFPRSTPNGDEWITKIPPKSPDHSGLGIISRLQPIYMKHLLNFWDIQAWHFSFEPFVASPSTSLELRNARFQRLQSIHLERRCWRKGGSGWLASVLLGKCWLGNQTAFPKMVGFSWWFTDCIVSLVENVCNDQMFFVSLVEDVCFTKNLQVPKMEEPWNL